MTPRLTVLLLLGLSTAGCSADPATSAGTTAPAVPAAAAAPNRLKACDLLTSTDVTGVIGDTVLAPEPNGFECAFRRPAEGVGGMLTRAVRLRLEQGAASPYDMYEQYTTTIRAALDGEYDPQSVAGVGSVAGWDGDALIAAEGLGSGQGFLLVVQLDGVSPEDEQRYAEAIAQAALARLRILNP
jgi:hypothetical protein